MLGVIKHKEHPFLDAIRQREDTMIYTVTEENRNEVKEQIKQDYLKRFSNK